MELKNLSRIRSYLDSIAQATQKIKNAKVTDLPDVDVFMKSLMKTDDAIWEIVDDIEEIARANVKLIRISNVNFRLNAKFLYDPDDENQSCPDCGHFNAIIYFDEATKIKGCRDCKQAFEPACEL